VNDLLIGLLSALLTTNSVTAASNAVKKATGITVNAPDPNDPVEKEYQKLLADDDAAEEEVEKWMNDAQAFAEQGAGIPQATLSLRIEERLKPVRAAYEDFLKRHPDHARARLAYGSFLDDLGEDEGARDQWEKARELDPKNPATWNNLANYYGHRGPAKKAFEYYAKAIELKPDESVYHRNLATTTYLFRKDAMEFYAIDEQKVFDRALELYRKALALDPENFELAADRAQSYYGIKPSRVEEALGAWQDALKIAKDDDARQGVYIHLARVEVSAARFDEARQHLDQVSLEKYADLKRRVLRNLAQKEAKAKGADTSPDAAKESSPAPAPPKP